jgi:hypothetical protein
MTATLKVGSVISELPQADKAKTTAAAQAQGVMIFNI